MDEKIFYTVKRCILVILGGVIMAFNINTFVHAGGLLPGGFTGVVLLVQEICQRFGNFHIPFSVMYYALNAVPAAFCFRYVGKKFTFYSVLMIFVSGILTDYMPHMFINFIQLHDTLLSAIFGGIINGIAIVLCLYADASSGGTDFIAIYISEKYRKESWNYIFFGNCVILAVAGVLFSLNKALYSIIFQYVTTLALQTLYRNYQQSTLLIITKMPDDVHRMIYQRTGHGATIIDCFGSFDKH
ncbi:MAG: YitT family protein, partial [Treponema sp.]|nr:YitT family protein [Treponema sp.]